MTVMAIYERPDVSSQLYNQFRAHVPLDAAPQGALAHAYGREGPGFVTVDIWEDRAALERYIAERIIPACEALGVAFQRPRIVELETFRATPAATARKHLLPFESAAASLTPA
ncbi:MULTISPECIES: hypothetical protein [unclassified Phenylobacterium]|jgi:hypothetical protein|uniref:hypothetical protein n=1 Tax=unclassified Phenylobacterium TaxID=2640670 RepID=UPI00083AF112|nr:MULTISPECIES: hypothetical protein [unclassified Phenylobacterium]